MFRFWSQPLVGVSPTLAIEASEWHKRPAGEEKMPDFALERRCDGLVCGVDEAGRGPLARPVVAAAVVIDRRRLRRELRHVLADSKVLSPAARESCYRALHSGAGSGAVKIGVGAACAPEVDR